MSFTLTGSGTVIAKAGANANSTITASGTFIQKVTDQAEGWVCAETRRQWVDNYSSLSTQIKDVLDDVVSSKAAMQLVMYDTSGYLAREADVILNVQDEVVRQGIKFLKDFKSNELKTP